jgi:hypothetical protein
MTRRQRIAVQRPRRKPYTERGIRRVPCARCGKPSKYQWQVCADGRRFRGICATCDIGLNELALRYMRIPNAGALMRAYRRKVLG